MSANVELLYRVADAQITRSAGFATKREALADAGPAA
jgi:hypothetical protein